MENVMHEKSENIIVLIYQMKNTLLVLLLDFVFFFLVNQFCKNIKSKLDHFLFLFITLVVK